MHEIGTVDPIRLAGVDRFVAIDFEANGGDFARSRAGAIIEVGAVAIEREGRLLKPGATFHSLVWTSARLDRGAQSIHGIGRRDLDGAPNFRMLWPRLQAFLKDSPLVAHDASSDRAFLDHDLKLIGAQRRFRWICTRRSFQLFRPGDARSGLRHAAATMHAPLDPSLHHRALHDAMATANVFVRLEASLRRLAMQPLAA